KNAKCRIAQEQGAFNNTGCAVGGHLTQHVNIDCFRPGRWSSDTEEGATHARDRARNPTLKPRPDQPEAPVNVTAAGRGRGHAGRGGQGQQGLRVNWLLWRGPAAVTFDPAAVQVKDGKAVTTAKFTKPGTYIMRARANDGELTDQKEFTVN